jgi:hypothetical protein
MNTAVAAEISDHFPHRGKRNNCQAMTIGYRGAPRHIPRWSRCPVSRIVE